MRFRLPWTSPVLSVMQPFYIFFRRKYDRDSNYRLFVLLLASFDIGMSIAHIIKEQFRLRCIFNAGVSVLCPITNYVGHSIGIGTIFMVLFIAVERYKKICTPSNLSLQRDSQALSVRLPFCRVPSWIYQYPLFSGQDIWLLKTSTPVVAAF